MALKKTTPTYQTNHSLTCIQYGYFIPNNNIWDVSQPYVTKSILGKKTVYLARSKEN